DAIARLLPNGVLDPAFEEHEPNTLLQGDIHRLFLQRDGNLLAGWDCFRRFNTSGIVDVSLTNCPNIIAVQADNKLLAVTNELPSSPFRLFPDGSRDSSFSTTVEVGESAPSTLVVAVGRFLIVNA